MQLFLGLLALQNKLEDERLKLIGELARLNDQTEKLTLQIKAAKREQKIVANAGTSRGRF